MCNNKNFRLILGVEGMGEFPSKEHQFKPGQSGNEGNKGYKQIQTRIREHLAIEIMFDQLDAEVPESIKKKMQVGDAMVVAMIKNVLYDGDVSAFKALIEHSDGKPVQQTENRNININEALTTDIDKKILGEFAQDYVKKLN